MPIAEKSPDSEQELRWRRWQEKGRRADRLADRRLKVLFSVVGLILLACILYYAFWTKASPDSDHVQNAAGSNHISILIVWQFFQEIARVSSVVSDGITTKSPAT